MNQRDFFLIWSFMHHEISLLPQNKGRYFETYHRKFQEITQYLVNFISLQKALNSERKMTSPEQGLEPWTFRLKA